MKREMIVGVIALGLGIGTAMGIAAWGTARRAARRVTDAIVLPRGEAHMWGILGGYERAEQVTG